MFTVPAHPKLPIPRVPSTKRPPVCPLLGLLASQAASCRSQQREVAKEVASPSSTVEGDWTRNWCSPPRLHRCLLSSFVLYCDLLSALRHWSQRTVHYSRRSIPQVRGTFHPCTLPADALCHLSICGTPVPAVLSSLTSRGIAFTATRSIPLVMCCTENNKAMSVQSKSASTQPLSSSNYCTAAGSLRQWNSRHTACQLLLCSPSCTAVRVPSPVHRLSSTVHNLQLCTEM